ncbi:MAG: DUF3800 domain-containing protein [bacterium]
MTIMTRIMFLDESGDHSLDKIDKSYPMFVLAGCIFDLDYYSKSAEPKVNALKIKYFGKTDIKTRNRKRARESPSPSLSELL